MAKLSGLEEGGDERQPAQHTTLQRLGMLAKFMLPLLITNMVPEVAEQASRIKLLTNSLNLSRK